MASGLFPPPAQALTAALAKVSDRGRVLAVARFGRRLHGVGDDDDLLRAGLQLAAGVVTYTRLGMVPAPSHPQETSRGVRVVTAAAHPWRVGGASSAVAHPTLSPTFHVSAL